MKLRHVLLLLTFLVGCTPEAAPLSDAGPPDGGAPDLADAQVPVACGAPGLPYSCFDGPNGSYCVYGAGLPCNVTGAAARCAQGFDDGCGGLGGEFGTRCSDGVWEPYDYRLPHTCTDSGAAFSPDAGVDGGP